MLEIIESRTVFGTNLWFLIVIILLFAEFLGVSGGYCAPPPLPFCCLLQGGDEQFPFPKAASDVMDCKAAPYSFDSSPSPDRRLMQFGNPWIVGRCQGFNSDLVDEDWCLFRVKGNLAIERNCQSLATQVREELAMKTRAVLCLWISGLLAPAEPDAKFCVLFLVYFCW